MARMKPDGLTPKAASLCTALLEACRAEGIPLTLTSTLRTPAEQDALYAQGRMPLDAVNSLRSIAGLGPITHEANRIVTTTRSSAHMEGRAFDVAVLKDGAIDWSATSLYERAGAIGKRLGLRWGGDFKRLRDLCHFELPVGSLEPPVGSLEPPIGSLELPVGSLDLPVPATEPTHKGAHGGPINQKHQEDNQMSDASTVKSGLRTSEFYLALIGAVSSVLNGHLGLNIPTEGLLSLAGIVISYVVSRTAIKKAAA